MIEDFVPIGGDRALIAAGPSFTRLNVIAEVDYQFRGAEVAVANPTILVRGQYLRLGHRERGALVYTDGWRGPHQPHRTLEHLYYANGAPAARIYRDGRVFIDHWPGIAEIGKPWVDGDAIFFEARDAAIGAPWGWSVFMADLDGRHPRRVCAGANPCVFNGKLWFEVWNGHGFDLARTDRPDRLPADAHVSA